jgi:regulatory protein YycI of two-component signal transduction system YycFG
MEFILGFVLVWIFLDKVFSERSSCDCCEELEDDLDELDVDLHREIENLQAQINGLNYKLDKND